MRKRDVATHFTSMDKITPKCSKVKPRLKTIGSKFSEKNRDKAELECGFGHQQSWAKKSLTSFMHFFCILRAQNADPIVFFTKPWEQSKTCGKMQRTDINLIVRLADFQYLLWVFCQH